MRLFLLFLLFAFSCSQHKDKTLTANEKIELYPAILDSTNGSRMLAERVEEAKLFNLSPLSKKGEQFELRIIPWSAPWLRFGMGKDVFVFKKDSSGWQGFHYFSNSVPIKDLDGKESSGTDSVLGQNTFLVKKLTPLCGWSKFSDSINYFQIEALPTEALIKNFQRIPILDGYGYKFEISRPTSYRYLTYNNPNVYNYEECKKVEAFMRMVRRQLGNDYVWPEPTL